jgi:hypothetical protein
MSPACTRVCPRHPFARAACANVPVIGARARARALRTQGLHESSLSTQALPCDGSAVCPDDDRSFIVLTEIDTRQLGITAGMAPGLAKSSRKASGSGGKAAKLNQAESSAGASDDEECNVTESVILSDRYRGVTVRS